MQMEDQCSAERGKENKQNVAQRVKKREWKKSGVLANVCDPSTHEATPGGL
jgi:hypothetical protein